MHKNSYDRAPRRRREKEPEKIVEEIIVENFPNMGKDIVTQIQEAQRVPYRIIPRGNLETRLIKLTNIKDKDKILQAQRKSNK